MDDCGGIDGSIKANGLKLHFVQWGDTDARPMVLLHGVASFGRIWDFIAPAFQDEYRVLALDWRGHGDSEWPPSRSYQLEDYVSDLHAFLAALDLRDVTLLAHSLGAWVGLNYVVGTAERVRSVVATEFRTGFTAEELEQSQQQSQRPQREYATMDEVLNRFAASLAPTRASSDALRHLGTHAVRNTPSGGWTLKFDRAVLAAQELNPWEVYRHVGVPTLVLRGARSPIMSHEAAVRVGEEIRGARVVEIDDAYHHLFLDQAEQLIALVRSFLQP